MYVCIIFATNVTDRYLTSGGDLKNIKSTMQNICMQFSYITFSRHHFYQVKRKICLYTCIPKCEITLLVVKVGDESINQCSAACLHMPLMFHYGDSPHHP